MLKRPAPRLKPDAPIQFEKIKVVVVGESNVGKTQFLKSYCQGEFSNEYDKTIGSDFFTHNDKYGTKMK